MINNWGVVLGEFTNICKDNHIFPECKFIDMLKRDMPQMETRVSAGEILYRARIYSDNLRETMMRLHVESIKTEEEDELKKLEEKRSLIQEKIKNKIEKGFRGYDEAGSFVNLDRNNIKAGRCNCEFEPCLYMAEDVETAISEIKPLIKEQVSVAKIQVDKELKLIDVSVCSDEKNMELRDLVGVFFLVSPTASNKDAYICTQVICAVVKKYGYDGIIYSSCQNHHKKNYAIFNYGKCKAISSKIYSIERIKYEVKDE